MQSAKDITIDMLRPKTLVMSPPLWGKTRFASTWCFGNTYYFDFDGNMSTVFGQDKIYFDTYKDVDIRKPAAYQNAVKTLDAIVKSIGDKGYIELDGIKIEHVVIDSASALLESCMNLVLFTKGKVGSAPTSSDWKDNDWTAQMVYFNNFLNRVLALPCAVTLNCHEHLDKSEIESEKRIYPDITGKIATKIGSKFNLVFRLTVTQDFKTKTEKYMLLTKSQGMFYAGHRFSDALEMYEEADWRSVLKKIGAYIEKKKLIVSDNPVE